MSKEIFSNSDTEQKIKGAIDKQRNKMKNGLKVILFSVIVFASYHLYVLLMSL